ncbi:MULTISPECIES: RND family transporter [Peptoniphilus]|jgi:putative membrane protein|uniref:efflux RND transporter permease subunit n=1 Tax=Peptoniphilus TaxID=162289 RepID=UPI000289366D|nr:MULTISPECIES: MMPL family transporter [Peptoniphilus]MDU1043361.1 MMPL family transporter [Peptoniphilus rhinitidis]MDU2115316.1 MMPL family transporter [Peptoniphilus lacydonensis]MDU3750282.1 MMPL family transporter [Peptoniphilus rhinitidis]MDU5595209.1 MMPL family transporter [Peptoniphilus rhinitidis]MDU7301887.1 MMPL family transporter [Peptoniphilus lacydonensis]
MKKFTKFISHRPKFVLLVMTFLLFPSIIGYKLTGVNYDILSYLPNDLKSTQGQQILDEEFKNAATGMLILEGSDHDAEVLREKILEIDGVEDVISKSSTVGDMIPSEFLPDEIKDIFYADGSTLMIVKFSESSSSLTTMNAIDKIRDIGSKPKYLSGISSLVKDTKDLIDEETPIYVVLAVVLGLIVLSITNESTIVPFVFLLTIGYAVLYNFGTNVFLGEISYITKAIAAVLQLAVTMDYSIFLYHKYVDEKKNFDNKYDAMDVAVQKTISSLFASSLTTFAGFIVLIAMRLGLGKDIGLVMSKGVLIGLIATITVLPAMLLVVEKLVNKYNHRVLLPEFDKVAEFTVKNKKKLFTIFLVLFLPSMYGSINTKLYYNLDRSLPQDLDSIVALNKMKKDYDMASTHFIVVKDDLSNSDLDGLINDVKGTDGINSVLSVSSLTGFTFPSEFLPDKVQDNFSKGGYQMIMANSKYQTASPEVKKQVNTLKKVVNKYDKNGYLTGEAVLTDDLTVISDRDFKVVNIISISVVFLIIAIVFKSFGIPVVLIAAIELAIQINMGIPFYLNHTIPFITSIIIGVIQLGSTIDYSILMTDRFLLEYKETKDVDQSIRVSVKETSKSIVTSALSFMAATIGVGIYSKMEIVSTICIFLARGAIISMSVIIFLLPAIISISFPFVRKTTKGLD